MSGGAGIWPENYQQPPGLSELNIELGLTLEPAIPDVGAGLQGSTPQPGPLPTDTTQLLQLILRMLQQVDVDLQPDNFGTILKFTTAQVQAGTQYDYPIPSWARRFLLTNRSAGSGAAGQLYYFFNVPGQGSKTLPQNYRTLTAGQSIAESSNYNSPAYTRASILSVSADPSMTDQGWELSFMGWYGLLYNPLPPLA